MSVVAESEVIARIQHREHHSRRRKKKGAETKTTWIEMY
jgi:hypothetical protein